MRELRYRPYLAECRTFFSCQTPLYSSSFCRTSTRALSMFPPPPSLWVGAVPTVDASHGRDLWPTERPSPCYIQGWEEGMDLVKDHLADIYPHTRRTRFDYGILENRISNGERSVDRENASTQQVYYWMETAHRAEYICTPPNISISVIRVAPREQRCAATTSTAAAATHQ
jgi:hypothetical protein